MLFTVDQLMLHLNIINFSEIWRYYKTCINWNTLVNFYLFYYLVTLRLCTVCLLNFNQFPGEGTKLLIIMAAQAAYVQKLLPWLYNNQILSPKK